MPTNSQHNTSKNEDIDLVSIFITLGEFFKKTILGLINFSGSVLVFLLRKWYYLIIALFLTVISALILNNISDPYYYSDLVIRSNATHNQPIMSYVNRLGTYAEELNFEALSNELNLSIEDASSIKEINTYWYYDINNDGFFDGIDKEGQFLADTNVHIIDSVFVLNAAFYNPGILDKLEEGVKQYLETNPFLNALNMQRLSDLGAQLNQTEYEIAKLDSLQKREYYTNSDQLRQKEGQIVFTSEKVIRMYHNDMFRLLRFKQECERDLNIYSSVVTILEGFTIPVKPDNGTSQYAKKLIWYYLGLAILIAVLVTYRKKIRALLKSG
jgi:hypothetical protein